MRTAIIVLAVLFSTACEAKPNGCSGGMSAYYRNAFHSYPVWVNCCNAHDNRYSRGDTELDRMRTDDKLASYVATTNFPMMNDVIWFWIRVGGAPHYRYRAT